MKKLNFDEVCEALYNERIYQKRRWGVRSDPHSFDFTEKPHTVCDFLTYMRDYLAEADKAATRNSGDELALDALRKVVTLGIACFEQHGVPDRGNPQSVTNGHDGCPA